jgi:hypothetical protein
MALGGPIFQPYHDPDSWIAALRSCGYTAAYAPQIPDGFIPADFAGAADAANIRIAEVGVWNNPPRNIPRQPRMFVSLLPNLGFKSNPR